MKRTIIYCLVILLLLLSLIGCGSNNSNSKNQEILTKNHTDAEGNSIKTPETAVKGIAKLGSLENLATISEWSPGVHEEVAVSPDGKYVAVASFDHFVHLYEQTGKKLWDYKIPSGLPVSVAFSTDGSEVFFGESSTDANLYAFDTTTGKLLWQYTFSQLVGSGASPRWSNQPKVRALTTVGDLVIAAGEYRQRLVKTTDERSQVIYQTQCVIIAFDAKSGLKKWQYPNEGTMDSGIYKIASSRDGKKIAFANHSWTPDGQAYPDGSIRLLNGKNGQLVATYQVDVLEPFFRWVGIYDGVEISPNGKYLVAIPTDSRVFLFDLSEFTMEESNAKLPLLWMRQVSKVHNIGGIPIYASGNTAYVNDDGDVYAMTSLTYLADKTATTAPPFNHPDAGSLFAYNLQGELVWKWQTDGGVARVRFSDDSRFMIAAVFHNYVTNSKERSGLYCFDLKKGNDNALAWFYPVGGIAVAGDIAKDGTTIAVCEAPIRMKDNVTIGSHRLHILQ